MSRKKRYFGIFLLILYVFFFASANLQQHIHIIDGITIIHSHFSKDSNPFSDTKTTHSHTKAEINIIYNLNIALLFISFIAIILGVSYQISIKIVLKRAIIIPKKTRLCIPSLRAPPFC